MKRVTIVCLLLLAACKAPPPLPVLGQVPPFTLTGQDGQPFGSDQLAGKVWIANFIFTRCPDICPTFTARMADVQRQTRTPVLVSFSVDPAHDTPPVLAEYGEKHGADFARWHFVTGDEGKVRQAVEKGLLTAMEREGEKGGVPQIGHGSHFVLVDGKGQIRGTYDMNDNDAVARVVRDASRL